MSQEEPTTAERLAEVLGEQVELYGALLELARAKQKVLVDGGLDDLEHVVQAEQAVLWRAGKAEERRLLAQEELRGELGLPAGGDVTLVQLLERVSQPTGDRYRELAARLKALGEELWALNQANTELIKQALAYVRLSLKSLEHLGGAGKVYQPSGSPGQVGKGPSRFLNRKA